MRSPPTTTSALRSTPRLGRPWWSAPLRCRAGTVRPDRRRGQGWHALPLASPIRSVPADRTWRSCRSSSRGRRPATRRTRARELPSSQPSCRPMAPPTRSVCRACGRERRRIDWPRCSLPSSGTSGPPTHPTRPTRSSGWSEAGGATPGAVIFFTGLSGSGKSTIARALADELADEEGRTVTLLDGDEVRQVMSADLGFDAASRETNIARIGYVAALVAAHGGIAVAAPIAPFAAGRQAARAMVTPPARLPPRPRLDPARRVRGARSQGAVRAGAVRRHPGLHGDLVAVRGARRRRRRGGRIDD